ncbi:hypothetical protein [Apilactobacillus ozensis]|uniref:hypothetical protein n=1 Tax=Apilactobacillus ozensis TaxID=866801 RepID=UPI00138F6ED8|nr:hypothetical protein [Apilactobacillus ozensis]
MTSLITGSVVAAIITAVFNRINSEKSSIHSESEWRADLYKLSQKTEISRQDLELFRTCLSATRGMDNKLFDERTANRYLEIDDVCLFYYHYLLSNRLINIRRNMYVRGANERFVFRQLCRILLKSDWNTRDVKNSIMNKLSCFVKTSEEDKKAVSLVYKVCDFTTLNANDIDYLQKQYFHFVKNGSSIISFDISKAFFIISLLMLIYQTLQWKYLTHIIYFLTSKGHFFSDFHYVISSLLASPLCFAFLIYIPIEITLIIKACSANVRTISQYIKFRRLSLLIEKFLKLFKRKQHLIKFFSYSVRYGVVSIFLICLFTDNKSNAVIFFPLLDIYFNFINSFLSKSFGFPSNKISHDFYKC